MIRDVAITESEQATVDLGARLAGSLGPGAAVLLEGELGAGKTAFVRGLAIGLGAPEEGVSSPTFTLIQEYRRPDAVSPRRPVPDLGAEVTTSDWTNSGATAWSR